MARAAELLYTADTIDAPTALAWGLVSRIVPAAELMREARALADRISRQPPDVLRMTKRLLRQSLTQTFDGILELSAAMQALAHHTEDHAEAVASFFEKRTPTFVGR
jgi:enoyl-CoA hydratase/carnithine racemase